MTLQPTKPSQRPPSPHSSRHAMDSGHPVSPSNTTPPSGKRHFSEPSQGKYLNQDSGVNLQSVSDRHQHHHQFSKLSQFAADHHLREKLHKVTHPLSSHSTEPTKPSERPPSPHSSRHDVHTTQNAPHSNRNQALKSSTESAQHVRTGSESSTTESPQLADRHVDLFLSQVKQIDKMKPSFTAFDGKFQLYHLRKELDFEDSSSSSRSGTRNSTTSGQSRRSRRSSAGNRITFAVKMQFPKDSFERVVYRIGDLTRRKEWDSNYAEGRIVADLKHLMNPGAAATTQSRHQKESPKFSSNNRTTESVNNHDIIYIKMKSPTKLVKPRDTLLYRYTKQLSDSRVVSIMQTYDDKKNALSVSDLPPYSRGIVRAQTHFHGYLIEKLADSVQVTMLSSHYIGNVPEFVVKMLFDKKSVEWYKEFSEGVMNLEKRVKKNLRSKL